MRFLRKRAETLRGMTPEDKGVALYLIQYNFSKTPEAKYPHYLRSAVSKQLSGRMKAKLDLNTGKILEYENPFYLL